MKNITSLIKGTASFLYRHSRARGNPGFNLLLLLTLAASIAPRYAQSQIITDLYLWRPADDPRVGLEIRNKTDQIVRTIDAMVDSDCGIFTGCRDVSSNDYRKKLNKASLLLTDLKKLCNANSRGDECVYSDYIDALVRVAEDAPEAGLQATESIGEVAYRTRDRNTKNKALRALANIVFKARPLTETSWGQTKMVWHAPALSAIRYLGYLYYVNVEPLENEQSDFILRVLKQAADPDIEQSPYLNETAYSQLENINAKLPPELVEKHRKLREQEAKKVQRSVGRYDWRRGNRQ